MAALVRRPMALHLWGLLGEGRCAVTELVCREVVLYV